MCASGATCPNWHRGDEILPAALPPTPTLEQITGTINANTNLPQSDWADGLYFGARGAVDSGERGAGAAVAIPLLAPRRQSRGRKSISAATMRCFGSGRGASRPAALYFCRHDQFFASSARSIFPVEPDWMLVGWLLYILPGRSAAVDVIRRRESARDSIGADSPGRQYQQANDRRCARPEWSWSSIFTMPAARSSHRHSRVIIIAIRRLAAVLPETNAH